MSKSKGNAVDPFDALNTYGADSIRWYFYTAGAPDSEAFPRKSRNEGQRKSPGTLWNTYAFMYCMQISTISIRPDTMDCEKLSVMDKWLLSKMNSMVKDVDKNLGAYKIPEAVQPMSQDFV